jgi:hypothetical protein
VALGFLILTGKLVTLKEFLVQLAAVGVFAGCCVAVVYYSNTADEEHINGQVTAKKSERVSCRHPYCCMTCQSCTTDSKGNTSCTSYCCMTCYDHPYDIDWNVYSNSGKNWSINTIDRQGLKEPPRWTSTTMGEPVTWLHTYENYIKAAPGTLFKRDTRKDEARFPLPVSSMPVFDYWHTNQLVQVGTSVSDTTEWNRGIEAVNGAVGPTKQANLVVVLVKNQPREYFEALQAKWLGGKKNDVTVVIGVDDTLKIQWADVMAWSYNEMIRVELRDSLTALPELDRVAILDLAKDNIQRNFTRKHMDDFKYLTASFTPTGTQYAISILLGTLLSIGLGIVMIKNDLFNEGPRSNTYRSF